MESTLLCRDVPRMSNPKMSNEVLIRSKKAFTGFWVSIYRGFQVGWGNVQVLHSCHYSIRHAWVICYSAHSLNQPENLCRMVLRVCLTWDMEIWQSGISYKRVQLLPSSHWTLSGSRGMAKKLRCLIVKSWRDVILPTLMKHSLTVTLDHACGITTTLTPHYTFWLLGIRHSGNNSLKYGHLINQDTWLSPNFI